MSEPTAPLCGLVQDECRCVAADGHVGPHVCDCGGSWSWTDGRFHSIALPGSGQPEGSLGRTLADLFGGFAK